MFFSGVDNPIIRLKRTGHVDVPALSNACNLRRLAKPLLWEAFFNAIVSKRTVVGGYKPVASRRSRLLLARHCPKNRIHVFFLPSGIESRSA